jgi:hypothetical protein
MSTDKPVIFIGKLKKARKLRQDELKTAQKREQ